MKAQQHRVPLLAMCWLLSLLSLATTAATPIAFEQATVTVNDTAYQVEYAQTFEQRARGLMFRKQLCEDCGMLFRFSPPKQASMWMKNTFVPLDVAFITKDGVITDIKPLEPHDLTSVGASRRVTYALEMNQGWFAQHDVQVGDTVHIELQ